MGKKFNSIRDDLESTIHQLFRIAPAEDRRSIHFFNKRMGLRARDLLDLTYQLEAKYSVTFSENDFLNDNFYTINGLSELLLDKSDNGCGHATNDKTAWDIDSSQNSSPKKH